MQFPIGSKVKLSMYTSDDQIDYYYGHVLEVIECREDVPHFDGTHTDPHWSYYTIYTLVAPDGIVITANEYELEAANGPQAN